VTPFPVRETMPCYLPADNQFVMSYLLRKLREAYPLWGQFAGDVGFLATWSQQASTYRPFARREAISGRPGIGLGMVPTTTESRAPGFWRLKSDSFGRPPTGVGKLAGTFSMTVIRGCASGSMAESTMVSATLDTGTRAGDGTTGTSSTTAPSTMLTSR